MAREVLTTPDGMPAFIYASLHWIHPRKEKELEMKKEDLAGKPDAIKEKIVSHSISAVWQLF